MSIIINIFTPKLLLLIRSQESYYKVRSQATDITMLSMNHIRTSALMKVLAQVYVGCQEWFKKLLTEESQNWRVYTRGRVLLPFVSTADTHAIMTSAWGHKLCNVISTYMVVPLSLHTHTLWNKTLHIYVDILTSSL